MNLILTMAGKYSRFRKEGYNLPKYLLPWGNRSILSEILFELTKSKSFDNIFLVANKSDNDFLGHTKSIMRSYNIDPKNLILLSDTRGQAETAYLAIKEIEKISKLTNSIVFHNIDTILYNRDLEVMKNSLKSNDGCIDVFKSNNHEYSYVMVKNNLVSVISEKILISDLATSGLYGFASSDIFVSRYDGKDIYISDIYKKLINDKLQVCVGNTNSEKDTIVLGTPSEYIMHSKMLQ